MRVSHKFPAYLFDSVSLNMPSQKECTLLTRVIFDFCQLAWVSGPPKGLGERRRDRGDVRRGRGEGEEGKEVPFLSLPPFFASLLPLFPLGTPDTQAICQFARKTFQPTRFLGIDLIDFIHRCINILFKRSKLFWKDLLGVTNLSWKKC